MKKEIVILAASALLTQIAFAQESKTVNTVTEEKTSTITIGAGAVLASSDWGNLKGFAINANKICTKKLSLGISTDMGKLHVRGSSAGSFDGAIQFNPINGIYANFFAAANYYFLGDAAKSKAGMYGKLGLGAVKYNAMRTIAFAGYSGIQTIDVSSFNISAQLCFGGDVKIGKGRLFAETFFNPVLIGSISYKGSAAANVPFQPDSYTSKTNIFKGTNGSFGDIGLRLGYAVNF